MSMNEKRFNLFQISEEYWENNPETSLEAVLENYREGAIRPERAHSALGQYFEENYGSEITRDELTTNIEKEALAVYNVLDLTDSVIEKMNIDEIL